MGTTIKGRKQLNALISACRQSCSLLVAIFYSSRGHRLFDIRRVHLALGNDAERHEGRRFTPFVTLLHHVWLD